MANKIGNVWKNNNGPFFYGPFLGLFGLVLWGACVAEVKKTTLDAASDTTAGEQGAGRQTGGPPLAHYKGVPRQGKRLVTARPAKRYPAGSNDPLASRMAHLGHLNLGDVHQFYRGKGQVLIVSEGALDADHPDLKVNAALSKDYTAGNDNSAWIGSVGQPGRHDAHATSVAGLATMLKGNGVGMFGVAPEVELRSYNSGDVNPPVFQVQFDQLGVGVTGNVNFNYSYSTLHSIYKSYGHYRKSFLEYASENHPEFNFIYVTSAGNQYKKNCANCLIDWTNGFSQQKILLGNTNADNFNTHPNVIVAGGLSADGNGRYGNAAPGANIWISAPGHISTADISGCSEGYHTGDYKRGPFENGKNLDPNCDYNMSGVGTSYSTSLVSGAVVLMREACPRCTWREIKHALATTAVKVNPSASDQVNHPENLSLAGHIYQRGWQTNGAGFHFHNFFGFGKLDIKAAISYLENKATAMGELFNTLGHGGGPYYRSGNIDQAIPDAHKSGTSHSITVDAHNLAIEHILVTVNITHPRVADLGIELTSPSGSVSQLTTINSGIPQANFVDIPLASNAFYGENSLGRWTLKVIDGASGQAGTLKNWSLKIMGHQGGRAKVSTPPGIVSASLDSSRKLSWVLPAQTAHLRRAEVCVLATERQCQFHDWVSLPLTPAEHQIRRYRVYHSGVWSWQNINRGKKKVKIRLVDKNENVSKAREYNFHF